MAPTKGKFLSNTQTWDLVQNETLHLMGFISIFSLGVFV